MEGPMTASATTLFLPSLSSLQRHFWAVRISSFSELPRPSATCLSALKSFVIVELTRAAFGLVPQPNPSYNGMTRPVNQSVNSQYGYLDMEDQGKMHGCRLAPIRIYINNNNLSKAASPSLQSFNPLTRPIS